MRKDSKAAFFQVVLLTTLAFFGLDKAEAQDAPVTISDIDVAGVKLGMNVDQVVAALQASDPHYVIKKNYWTDDFTEFGQTGYPADKLSLFPGTLTPKFAFLTDLVAEDGTPPCSSGGSSASYYWDGCGNSAQLPYHVVQVWFSPVIGQERVIAVERSDDFYKSNGGPYGDTSVLPALPTVLSDISKKYPVPSYIPYTGEMDWSFDVKGRLVSPSMAKTLRLATQYNGGLPGNASSDGGSILSINYGVTSDQLVQTINSALFNEAALYNSVSEGHETFTSQNAKLIAQTAASAAKNGVSPNL